MNGWEANGQYLEYLSQLLNAACTVHDTAQQQQITKAMEDFNVLPEADRYLLILLIQPTVSNTVRSMAGLILKNNLRQRPELTRETISFMRNAGLVDVLSDAQPLVRRTVGTLMASIARRLGRELGSFWPDLIPTLLNLAAVGEEQVAASAADTIAKICEDASDELLEDPTGPVTRMIPELIRLISASPTEAVRTFSLLAINSFIFHDNVLAAHLTSLLTTLSERASVERGGRMRLAICQSLNMLLEAYPEEMQPILSSIFDYMLAMLQDRDGEDAVALEACEFWLSIAERDSCLDLLTPRLPTLVPVLMMRVVYCEDDPDLEINNDHGQGSVANDVKPRHHDASYRGTMDSPRSVALKEGGEEGEIGDVDESEKGAGAGEDEEEEEEEDEDDNLQGQWTVRKCAAATIDVLATTMVERQFLAILLPLVNSFIADADWCRQEAGILALGAVSEGCAESMDDHFPQILPFLIDRVSSSAVPLVRAIAAWTISRYARCLTDPANINAAGSALGALLQGLLDGNRRVQHSSCTALSVVADKCPALIMSNLSLVTRAIHQALATYEKRNLIVLYDTLGTIADSVHESPKLCLPGAVDMVGLIGPALLQKWQSLETADPSTFALLECICSIVLAAPAHLAPYALAILDKALKMVQDGLLAIENCDAEHDLCIVALDLIGALSQGLRENLPPIFEQTSIHLNQLLPLCFSHQVPPQIKQSAFALIGDLASCAPSSLNNHALLCAIVRAVEGNMDVLHEHNTQGSANNAVWAAGELTRRYPTIIASELPNLAVTLAQFMQHYQEGVVSRGYMENVAVTLGRSLAVLALPTNLSSILSKWCLLMSLVTNPDERETAWSPMIAVLLRNPSVLSKESIPILFRSLATIKTPSAELMARIRALVEMIRVRVVGVDHWMAYRASDLTQVPPDFFPHYCL